LEIFWGIKPQHISYLERFFVLSVSFSTLPRVPWNLKTTQIELKELPADLRAGNVQLITFLVSSQRE
jgi:hypothetical protein